MSVTVNVTNRDYFYQLSNGDAFSTDPANKADHFSGSVAEAVKAVLDVEVFTLLQLQNWTYKLDGLGGSLILQDSVDFADEGFSDGDVIIITVGASVTEYAGNVTFAADGEIRFSNDLGLAPGDFPGSSAEGDWVRSSINPDALQYSFGLIGQNETTNFESKLTQVDNTFLFEGLTGAFQLGVSQGDIKGGVSGVCRAKFVGASNDYVLPIGAPVLQTVFKYQIELEFIILPFYQDGELPNLQSLTAPALFFGDATLRHVSQFDFRADLNNPNTSKVGEDEGNLGSVGWFDESFNGLPNDFTISGLSYEDNLANPLPSLEIGGATEATDYTLVKFSIESALGLLASLMPIVAGVSILPGLNLYNRSKDSFQDTWVFDNVRTTGLETSGLILKPSYAFVNANQIDVEIKAFYPVAVRDRIANGENYILSVLVADPSVDVNESQKAQLLVDLNTIVVDTDIAGLITFPILNFFNPGQLPESLPTEDAVLWVEDGAVVNYDFDLTDPNTSELVDLHVNIIAENPITGEKFTVQENAINLDSAQVVAGELKISLNETRGFNLPPDEMFNFNNLNK